MSAKPRLFLAALLAAAVALGAYAATRPDGGEADPTAALDAALSDGQPVYMLARSET